MLFCTIFDKYAWIYNFFIKLFLDPEAYYQKIKKLSSIKPNSLVLDVGGGTGLIATYFSNDVKRIVVLDPSKNMLSRITNDKIEKKVGIAQNIPFRNNTFDLIYCVDSFHHFTNGYVVKDYRKTTKLCIKELLRVLKKDGVLVIVEFDLERIRGRFIKLFENQIMRFGSKFYSKKEFLELFNKYDAKIEILDLDNYSFVAKISK